MSDLDQLKVAIRAGRYDVEGASIVSRSVSELVTVTVTAYINGKAETFELTSLLNHFHVTKVDTSKVKE